MSGIVSVKVVSGCHVTRYLMVGKNKSGGYCGGVPHLPIPNREVKPTCADGTAMQCGRVGNSLFSSTVLGDMTSSGTFYLFCFDLILNSFYTIYLYGFRLYHIC